jgi:hypothetical protein
MLFVSRTSFCLVIMYHAAWYVTPDCYSSKSGHFFFRTTLRICNKTRGHNGKSHDCSPLVFQRGYCSGDNISTVSLDQLQKLDVFLAHSWVVEVMEQLACFLRTIPADNDFSFNESWWYEHPTLLVRAVYRIWCIALFKEVCVRLYGALSRDCHVLKYVGWDSLLAKGERLLCRSRGLNSHLLRVSKSYLG